MKPSSTISAAAGTDRSCVTQRTIFVRLPRSKPANWAPDHLLAIDAEVLTLLVRTARDGEAPCDERSRVAGPAGLDRQAREVHVGALPDHILTGCGAAQLGRHVEHLHEHGPRVLPCVLEALGRLRLLQVGQQLTDLAQAGAPVRGIRAHAARDALGCTEQVPQHGNDAPVRTASRAVGAARTTAPARSARSHSAVISRYGSTVVCTRSNSPSASS